MQLVDVDYLEHQVAHLPNGGQRAALSIEPINLALRDDAEHDLAWRRYRGLLDSLTGPISVYSSSRPDPGGSERRPTGVCDPGLDKLAWAGPPVQGAADPGRPGAVPAPSHRGLGRGSDPSAGGA